MLRRYNRYSNTSNQDIDNPQVSVCIITYNHEDYIEQAIEGAIAQKTNFSFEIVIGEDYSTDSTREIVFEYQEKYPDIIKIIISDENVGAIKNFIRIFKKCKGKYVALLEGDDYLTDPYTLQKQVDFLEAHPDFVICFHNAKKLIQETGNDSSLFFTNPKKDVFAIKDIIRNNFIPTLTYMFRNNLIKEFPDWYYNSFLGDWPLHILNAQHGKIKYIDEVMATYRIHKGGLCSGSSPIENYERYIKTFEDIEKGNEIKQKKIIAYTISNFYFELSKLYVNKKNYNKAKTAILKCFKKYPFHSLKKILKIILLSIKILTKDYLCLKKKKY